MYKITSFIVLASLITFKVFSQGYSAGDKASDFKLKNVDGNMVSMADYKDAKGFIIIFSCNHCPFVKSTEGRMIALDKKFKPRGYPVIAINPNDTIIQPEDSFTEMQKRSREKGFTFPYLIDPTQETAKSYGASRTPHVYILERKGGDYIVRYIGSIDDNTRDEENVNEKFVEKAIEAIVAGKNPDPSETKAIGCTIKWRK